MSLQTGVRGMEGPGKLLPRRWRLLALAILILSLSVSLALMLTIFALARANPLQATRPWLATLASLFLMSSLGQIGYAVRLYRLPAARRDTALRPTVALLFGLLLLTATANVALYLSDDFHHIFTAEREFRIAFSVATVAVFYGVFEVSSALLVRARTGSSFLRALGVQIQHQAGSMTFLATGAMGLVLATSHLVLMGDDYTRYWAIADALSRGLGYPVSYVGPSYQAGGMGSALIDLPGLPMSMVAAFNLMGHNVLAAMTPVMVATLLFPPMAYLALQELTHHTVLSFVGTAGLAMFPLLLFYVQRAAEPDGMFLTSTMALAFLGIRCDNHRDNRWAWPALGIGAALAALTRPEGIMYAAITFLTLAITYRIRRGFWLALILCGALLAPFSVTMLLNFDTPWPTSFVGTVRPEHVLQNLDGLSEYALPRYAAALGVPEPLLVLLGLGFSALFINGSWLLAKRRPQLLFLALLPVMNAVTFLLVSPALTRPEIPYDFFRRASYGLPFLALVASYGVLGVLRSTAKGGLGVAIRLLLLAIAVSAVFYETKLAALPEESYPGGTQVLTAESYLLATDLLAHPYPLPWLPFERDGHALRVSGSFDYMSLRDNLNSFFKPLELHGSDRAAGYPPAALAIFLLGLCYAAASGGARGVSERGGAS